MRDFSEPKLPKWPFFIGDIFLLATAGFIFSQGRAPMTPWQTGLIVFCVAGGACLAIMPFLLEYNVWSKNFQAAALQDAVSQIKNLEDVGKHITGATAQWQSVQDSSEKTAAASREISEKMAAEIKGFSEFLGKANDSEKAHLRLEVEKLRRGEQEWLQVLIRVMDHIYALQQGALRSGQANVISQVGNFQNACREVARRVGLMPLIAEAGQPFTSVTQQVVEGEPTPGPGAVISEAVACGWSFQGKLLRPALVRLQRTGHQSSEGMLALEAESAGG
jgi:molecular chaperone GrpE